MKRLLPLFALALLSATTQVSHAGLLGVGDNNVLVDINTSTAVASNPRVMGNKIDMIAVEPNGTLYGVSQGFPSDQPPGGMLYQVNVATGAATYIATLDTYVITEGDIACDPTSGILYAIDAPGTLFTINTTTGAGTVIGNVGTGLDLSAMTFDAAGNLYMVESFSQTLYKVNKSTAAVIATLPMGSVGQQIGGLAFVPGNGTLFFAGGIPGDLYTVNTITGTGTLVAPITSAMGVWALAYLPDVTPTHNATWGEVKTRGR